MSTERAGIFSFLPRFGRSPEQSQGTPSGEQKPPQGKTSPAAETTVGTMGKICCQGDSEFFWKIDNFSSLPDAVNSYCRSPQFEYRGRTWYLRCHPNGLSRFETEGIVGLFLLLGDAGPHLEVKYSLGIKLSDGETQVWLSPTYTFKSMDTGWGSIRSILRSELFRRSDDMLPNDVLTLAVNFKAVTEEKLKKDVCVQTEVEHKVADVCVQTAFESNLVDATVQTADEDDGECEPPEKTGGEKVLQDMADMWISGENSDVVLRVKGVEFKAHRAILTARSPVLGAMFKHDTAEKASGEVTIDDCEPAVFEQLLQFIYTGALSDLTAEIAPALYVTADMYFLSEVKALCVRCIQDTMRPDLLCSIVTFSLVHGETELLEEAVAFLSKNMVDVMKTVEWQVFLVEHSTRANEILIRAMEREARNKKKNERT